MSNPDLKFDLVIATPYSRLGLTFEADLLSGVEYLMPDSPLIISARPEVINVSQQISCYFNDASYQFDVAMQLKGTDFQHRVWNEMRQIPAGQVKTYGEIAGILHSSPRAVGNACRANPIPLLIPCHRIVSANGLGGFSGATSGYYTDIKRKLLQHEGLDF
ncbi:MAG: methylated-DNA--[protein]-cysteine S-methyltransferase [Gammaproteobacteria bacterium]|nr:methylated-DNA--[protein]-cysteine S-methyltransferase [Gammaproteobacteria bacterium]